MNDTITTNKAKHLLHKLKLSNRMFFLEYQKPFEDRQHILCRMLLNKNLKPFEKIFEEERYNDIEVYNISDQSFIKLNINEILFIRYNDVRYYIISRQ